MTDQLTGREPALPIDDDITGREPFIGGNTSIVQALFQLDDAAFASTEVLATRLAGALPQLAALLHDEDQRKRSQAARLIGMVAANHPPSQAQSIPLLITILDEAISRDDGLSIGMAIESLGQTQNSVAVEALIQRTRYGFAGTFRSALARSGEIALPILLDMSAQEPDVVRRQDLLNIAADICRRNPAIVPYAADWLAPRILSHQVEPLWAYRRLINRAHPTQVIEPMATIASNPTADIEARLYASRVLCYIGDGTSGVMFELLEDEDPKLRYWAERALGEIKARSDIPKIIELIHSPNPRKRRTGLNIAGMRRLKSVIPAICEALSDSQSAIRCAAARALASIRNSDTIPVLCGMIDDHAKAVRYTVVRQVEWVYPRFPEHQEAMIAVLRKASTDPDEEIRWAAGAALRHLGASVEAS